MSETKRFYGVTSITKIGMGTGHGLVEWHARTPAETAYDDLVILNAYAEKGDRKGAIKWLMESRYAQSGAAKARGSQIHAAAEQLALGAPVEIDDELMPYVDQYRDFLEKFQPTFLMAEAPVYNTKFSYAGTTDGIFIIDGQRLLFDIKTVKYLPGELNESGKPRHRGPYEDVALQLAAYRNAELVGLMAERKENYYGRYYTFDPEAHYEPMPQVDGTIAIILSPADCRVIPVRTDDEVFKSFLAARECTRFRVDVAKRVFGPEITAREPDVPEPIEGQLALADDIPL